MAQWLGAFAVLTVDLVPFPALTWRSQPSISLGPEIWCPLLTSVGAKHSRGSHNTSGNNSYTSNK